MNQKLKNLKKGKQPAVPVAGPSKLKQPVVPETKPSVKQSVSSVNNPKEKEKPKASGKIEIFKAKPKEVKEIKTEEEPTKEAKKKMFFTKAIACAKCGEWNGRIGTSDGTKIRLS